MHSDVCETWCANLNKDLVVRTRNVAGAHNLLTQSPAFSEAGGREKVGCCRLTPDIGPRVVQFDKG